MHLDLSLATWAADGLLAIFFFVAGLELKREFVAGDLRDPRRAALPVAAAVGGMAVPALVYVAVGSLGRRAAATAGRSPRPPTSRSRSRSLRCISTHLPVATAHLPAHPRRSGRPAGDHGDRRVLHRRPRSRLPRSGLLPIAAFARPGPAAGQRGVPAPAHWPWWPGRWCTRPGVHATVAGVLLAFTVPVRRRDGRRTLHGLAERLEHLVRPVSAVFAVPVFAFFASGVDVGGLDGLAEALSNPVALGRRAGSGRRQDGRCRRARPGCCHVHPGPTSTTTSRGWTSWGCRCWRASASPCRC